MTINITSFADSFGDYAKDIKLNLAKLLGEEDVPGLSMEQVAGVTLAVAFSCRHASLTRACLSTLQSLLSADITRAAKAAATIMAMNNVYYRFLHFSEDADYAGMPAALRMQVLAKSGVPKLDFELMCLAVSAINGCGACMASHAKAVVQAGASKIAVQSAVRIAAVIQAAAQAGFIAEFDKGHL